MKSSRSNATMDKEAAAVSASVKASSIVEESVQNEEEAVAASALEGVIRRMDMTDLSRRLEQQRIETNVERGAAGFGARDALEAAPSVPDIPACDCCGKEYSGTLVCSRCESVFYCSKECQVAAWKKGGHKQACEGMKEACKSIANEVVTRMSNPSLPVHTRVQNLVSLDCAGPYKAAVARGLHAAIQNIFKDDEQHIMERYRTGDRQQNFCWTQFIMCTLFRGERFEGRGSATRGFWCIDAQRISAYVFSDARAFDDWMNASLEIFRVPLDSKVFENRQAHQVAHMAAQEVWAAWIMVFTSRRAAKAILLGRDRTPDDAAVIARAQSIAAGIKGLLGEFKGWKDSDERDPSGDLEESLNQVAAMVSYWVREFKVPLDFERILGLQGGFKQMYLQVSVPLAEARIKKGKSLTTEEAQMAVFSRASV